MRVLLWGGTVSLPSGFAMLGYMLLACVLAFAATFLVSRRKQ